MIIQVGKVVKSRRNPRYLELFPSETIKEGAKLMKIRAQRDLNPVGDESR